MEPLVQFLLGFTAALCFVFLIYGAWLCLRELVFGEAEQAPQDHQHVQMDSSIGSVGR